METSTTPATPTTAGGAAAPRAVEAPAGRRTTASISSRFGTGNAPSDADHGPMGLRRSASFAALLLAAFACVLAICLGFLHIAEARAANAALRDRLSHDAGILVARASVALAEDPARTLVTDPAALHALAAGIDPTGGADAPVEVRSLVLLTTDGASLAPLPAHRAAAADLPSRLPPLGDLAPLRDATGTVTSLPVEVVEEDQAVTAFVSFDTGTGAPLVLALQRDAFAGASNSMAVLVGLFGLLGATLLVLPMVARREALLVQQETAVAGLVRSKADALRSVNELDRVKGDFLTAVSNGFRPPLQAIQGLARQLVDPATAGDGRGTAALARELAGHVHGLDGLVRDLVDVDRLVRGTIVPTRREVDVAAAVAELAAGLGLAGRVRLDAPDPVPGHVDPEHLERITEHLLRNAVAFSPADAPVDVTVARDGEAFRLSVEDRGPGIATDQRLRVFDPLYRIERNGTSGGLGVGLALVQRLAAAHGGRAWAEPRAGGGSTLVVRIPDAGAERAAVDVWQVAGDVAT